MSDGTSFSQEQFLTTGIPTGKETVRNSSQIGLQACSQRFEQTYIRERKILEVGVSRCTHGSGENQLIRILLTYVGITPPKLLEIPFAVKPVREDSGPVPPRTHPYGTAQPIGTAVPTFDFVLSLPPNPHVISNAGDLRGRSKKPKLVPRCCLSEENLQCTKTWKRKKKKNQ